MEKLNEIYLVVYKDAYYGGEIFKELFNTLSGAEKFIKDLKNDEYVSDIKLFVCHEQNIDYLKEN